jgi:hypothetical protein
MKTKTVLKKQKTKLPEIKRNESTNKTRGSPMIEKTKRQPGSPLREILHEPQTDPIKVKLIKKQSSNGLLRDTDRSRSPFSKISPFLEISSQTFHPFEKVIKVSTLNAIALPKLDERSPGGAKKQSPLPSSHRNSFMNLNSTFSKSNCDIFEGSLTSTDFFQPDITNLNLNRNPADFEKKKRAKQMETIIEKAYGGQKTQLEVKEKDKDRNKKKTNFTKFSELTPANIDSEKSKFFESNFSYHPIFNYAITEIQSN